MFNKIIPKNGRSYEKQCQRRYYLVIKLKDIMKIIPALFLIIIINSKAAAQYELGEQVSDFTLQSYDGSMISLYDFKGDVVLLTFWFFGCAPCQQEAPVIQTELWEKYGDGNFQVLSIGVGETLEFAKIWADLYLLTHLIVVEDGSVFESYSPFSVFPHNVLLDQESRVLYSEPAFDLETMDAIIETNISVVSIEDHLENLPIEMKLHSAYPNPFNPSTVISFDLKAMSSVELSIFDLNGREVAVIFRGSLIAGNHSFMWHGKNGTGNDVPSGIYFTRLISGSQSQVRKVTLLK